MFGVVYLCLYTCLDIIVRYFISLSVMENTIKHFRIDTTLFIDCSNYKLDNQCVCSKRQ